MFRWVREDRIDPRVDPVCNPHIPGDVFEREAITIEMAEGVGFRTLTFGVDLTPPRGRSANPDCQQSASTTRTYGLTRGHTSLQRTLRNPR